MISRESAAYLREIFPHVTGQLALQERTVSILKTLAVDNQSSRLSTALALENIQAEAGRLAWTLGLVRAPVALTRANGYLLESIQQLASSVGELADALRPEATPSVTRIAHTRELARNAETSAKAAANALAASFGLAAATIPTVGPIIAAILMMLAAVISLIGQILAKCQEEEAKKKEKSNARP
jgi:hypothetical protein